MLMHGVRPASARRALAAGLLVLSACARPDAGTEQQPAAIPVRVSALRYQTLATPVEVSGSLAAVRSATIGAAAAGRILSVNVRQGDVVHTGDVIAQIDTAAYAAAVDQARAGVAAAAAAAAAETANVAAATANAAGARAQLDAAASKERIAATTAARMASLVAQGAISQQQADETAAALASARAAMAQAKAAVDAARSEVSAAQARFTSAAASAQEARAGVTAADVPLAEATVTAPFDGVITAKFVAPGAVVTTGSPIAAIQDDRHLEADVSVDDDAVSALSPGEPVAVRVAAMDGPPLHGRIRAIVPAHDPTLRSATVTIDVPSAPRLLSGMYVRVRFPGRGRPGWVAPLAALVTRAGQSGVFVVRGGTASFVPLQTGAVGSAVVELPDYRGPAADVAVTGIERIDDGSPVTVER